MPLGIILGIEFAFYKLQNKKNKTNSITSIKYITNLKGKKKNNIKINSLYREYFIIVCK